MLRLAQWHRSLSGSMTLPCTGREKPHGVPSTGGANPPWVTTPCSSGRAREPDGFRKAIGKGVASKGGENRTVFPSFRVPLRDFPHGGKVGKSNQFAPLCGAYRLPPFEKAAKTFVQAVGDLDFFYSSFFTSICLSKNGQRPESPRGESRRTSIPAR